MSLISYYEQNQADGHSQIVELYRAGDSRGEGRIPEALEGCAKALRKHALCRSFV